MDNNNVLVVGADGQIGQFLLGNLAPRYRTFGTSRRRGSESHFRFDLENPTFEFENTPFFAAIICCAMTKIIDCETNKERCKKINIENTIKTISYFFERDCFVLFLSSSNVFNGEKAFYDTSDCTNPINSYGKSKDVVEKFIISTLIQNVAILRITKIITPNDKLIEAWRSAIQNGREIRALDDRYIAPVTLEDVGQSVQRILNARTAGLFQLSSKEEMSYFSFAQKTFSHIDGAASLIAKDYSPSGGLYPKHNSLITRLP